MTERILKLFERLVDYVFGFNHEVDPEYYHPQRREHDNVSKLLEHKKTTMTKKQPHVETADVLERPRRAMGQR
jgi:hypothetical protein